MKRPWYTLLKFIAFVVLISLKSGETELEMYLIKAANAPLRLEPVLRSIVNYGIFLLGLNLGVSVLKYFYRRRKKYRFTAPTMYSRESKTSPSSSVHWLRWCW